MRVLQVMIVLCAGLPALGASERVFQDGPCCFRYREESVMVSGRTVEIEIFSPAAGGKHPAVLMIHGSAGLFSHPRGEPGSRENFGERQLACSGITAVLPHYLDISNMRSARSIEEMRAHAPEWLEALRAVLDRIPAMPNLERRHISIFGESLGGYLGTALGVTDKRIRLVVVYSSGDPSALVNKVKNHPAVLMYHGRQDSLVPIAEAMRGCDWLKSRSVPCRLEVRETLGHGLSPDVRAQIVSELIRRVK